MGIPVTDEAGQRLGHSVAAAKQGIFQVVISRICMAIPAMGEAGWLGGAREALRERGSGDSGGGGTDSEGGSSFLRIQLSLYLLSPSLPCSPPSHSPCDHGHFGEERLPEGRSLSPLLSWK